MQIFLFPWWECRFFFFQVVPLIRRGSQFQSVQLDQLVMNSAAYGVLLVIVFICLNGCWWINACWDLPHLGLEHFATLLLYTVCA